MMEDTLKDLSWAGFWQPGGSPFSLDRILANGLAIAGILVVAWLLHRGLRALLALAERKTAPGLRESGGKKRNSARAAEEEKRIRTLFSLAGQAGYIAIWTMSGMAVLQQVGINIAPLIASAGVVGLAIGFGAQNLVRDVITGFFLILENQVRVGDIVTINGITGTMERINFRTMSIRDFSGTLHVIPNGTVTMTSNMTIGWSAYIFEIGVAYRHDVDRVMRLIEETGRDMLADPALAQDLDGSFEMFGVDSFGDSSVVIKGRIRTSPSTQWKIGREFLRRVKIAFDREGIEIPFPQRSLHLDPGILRRIRQPDVPPGEGSPAGGTLPSITEAAAEGMLPSGTGGTLAAVPPAATPVPAATTIAKTEKQPR